MKKTAINLTFVLASIGIASSSIAGDWPRFRGPNGNAISDEKGLATTWSDTSNVAWKVGLAGPGSSSPIVSGDRVFVTCYSGYGVDRANPGDQANLKRHVVCVGLADGKVKWDRSVPAVLPEDRYSGQLTQHGYASSTPATDGERVFAFFGKSGVVAFDNTGKELWKTSVGTGSAIMGWGSGTSLVVYKDLVIVNANAESESVVALDKSSGKQVWKAEATGYTGSWSTPVLVPVGERQELAIFMQDEVWALDPDTGSLIWHCGGVRGAPTSSLVSQDGVIYAAGGGPRGAGAVAIRSGGRNDVSASHVVWKQNIGSYVPSPVTLGGHVYWVDDRGQAYCLKADTGKQVYRERIPGAGGVYASVVAADGKLLVVSRRSGTFILPAAPEFKVLAQNTLESDGTDFNASPAISQGRILLRSNRFLYCISAQ